MKKVIISTILAVFAAFTLTACSEVSEIKESVKNSRETLSEVKESVSNIKNGTTGSTKDENEAVKEDAVNEEKEADAANSNLEDTSESEGNTSDIENLIDEAKSGDGEKGLLSSPEDINLTDSGDGENYTFTYGDEVFSAIYTEDNWRIIDSYKISNVDDNLIICQALIDEHPIHGSDMASYRTADDMAYEWLQHNIAYEILPDDNSMKSHAKDVDLDPKDQGKDFDEIYEDRTGKEFSLDDFGF